MCKSMYTANKNLAKNGGNCGDLKIREASVGQ